MPASTRRRLTIVDGMILVGTTCVGLAGFVGYYGWQGYPIEPSKLFRTPPRGWRGREVVYTVVEALGYLTPLAGGWTVVLPALRLRPPRPRLRRLLRQPGLAACLAAWLGLAISALVLVIAANLALLELGGWREPPKYWARWFIEVVFVAIAVAIVSTWFGLALAGRVRSEPDWIDRTGRALGVYWIILGLAWGCVHYAPLF